MYIIKGEAQTDLGVVVYTLGDCNQFYRATNDPLRFESVAAAQAHWDTEYWRSKYPTGKLFVYIAGPKGGTYSMKRFNPFAKREVYGVVGDV